MRKVYAKTKEEFIKEVVADCILNLTDENIKFLLNHPDYTPYHFGYGFYIRNKYIHAKDCSEAGFWPDPDELSGEIFDQIITNLRNTNG